MEQRSLSKTRGGRTVSSSSTATQPPPYTEAVSTPPFALPSLPRVRRHIENPSEEKYAVSGQDRPDLVVGRRSEGLTGVPREVYIEGQSLFSPDAYITVKNKVDEYLRTAPPLEDTGLSLIDRKKLDVIAMQLYEAVAEGKAELRHFGAPALLIDCDCERQE
jgi:hypothetical protein